MHDSLSGFAQLDWGHPCRLLVHSDIESLEQAADSLLRRTGWPRLSIGRELSAALSAELPRDRPRAGARWLTSHLAAMAPGPVICSEIDLLFEPSLSLDALALLRAASRLTRLVVIWPGSSAENVLTYAVAEHDHYRAWRRPEADVRRL
jgi:hypothetical protein